MDNQQVFEMLSELEEFFNKKGYEVIMDDDSFWKINAIWEYIRKSLLMWHEYTGCVNTGLPLSRFYTEK